MTALSLFVDQQRRIEMCRRQRDTPMQMRTIARQLDIAQRHYKVSRIDGLPERKVTPNPEDLRRIRDDNAKIASVRRRIGPGTGFLGGFLRPAEGRISGVFGSQRVLNGKPRRPHYGLDIAAPIGTPVYAAADGTVALVDSHMFLTGQTVMIDHGLGLTSVYIHMSEITVTAGQKVIRGDRIGAIGMSGRAIVRPEGNRMLKADLGLALRPNPTRK